MSRDQVISYRRLRMIVGILGMGFPIVLAVLGLVLEDSSKTRPSISDYYHSDFRDLFVGVLCAISVFFLVYTGPRRRDDIAGDLACVFALGIAFLPTGHPDRAVAVGHGIAATGLFLVLAYFALVLFPAPSPGGATPDRGSLLVFKYCGVLMLLCMLGALVYVLALPAVDPRASIQPLFWLEALALLAFGVSWFRKGQIAESKSV